MSSENFKIQLRKGLLEFCILQILSKNKFYTSEIIGMLNESNMNVVEGTVYPILNRLENKEYVNIEWAESRQGPPRKYFLLTKRGKTYLKQFQTCFQEVNSSIDKLIK